MDNWFLLVAINLLTIPLLFAWVRLRNLKARVKRLENTLNDHGIYPQKENE